MKLVILSDTHTFHRDIIIPDGDILIHCGDSTHNGTIAEMKDFLGWLNTLPHEWKILINGNHEVEVSKLGNLTRLLVQEMKNPNLIYLENESVTINGLNFYGSPNTPEFGYGWAYMYDRSDAYRIWSKIPLDTDVLITHGMPYSCLDKTNYIVKGQEDGHAGCKDLFNRIKEIKPSIVVGGHLHLQGGQTMWMDGILIINAAMCDESYKITRQPVIVDTEYLWA